MTADQDTKFRMMNRQTGSIDPLLPPASPIGEHDKNNDGIGNSSPTSRKRRTPTGLKICDSNLINSKLHTNERERPLSRSMAIPPSLTNLRAHLTSSTSSPSTSQHNHGEDDDAAPMFPIHFDDGIPHSNTSSPPRLNRRNRKSENKSPSRCAVRSPKHRHFKKHHYHENETRSHRFSKHHRSLSLSPRTKHENSEKGSASTPNRLLPYLWTEGFAKDVSETIKGPVERFIQEGRLSKQPTNRFWSSLTPQDIIRPVRRRSEMGNSESESDSYKEEDVLGAGSFSCVTRVQIRGKGKGCYALKHLKSDLLPSKLTEQSSKNGSITAFTKAATEMAREAFLLSQFEHPNIIRIMGWTEGGVASYSTFRRHDAFFLVLELLQEETLDDRIDRWNHDDEHLSILGYSPDELKTHEYHRKIEQLKICKQIASALAFIHSKNVVYRDLKPQNIGFCRSEQVDRCGSKNVIVKLMDFGLARELPLKGRLQGVPKQTDAHSSKQPLFDMTGTVGTIRYMAPEVCLNRPYGLECDIYSWSIVSHEILSQKKPFDDMTPDLYQTLVCQQGVRPSKHNMSSEYTNLLTQTWKADPSKRLPFDQIQRQLDLFLQKEKLLWEAQELLSGMPESNDSSSSLYFSYSDDNMSSMGSLKSLTSMHHPGRKNKRSWNHDIQTEASSRQNAIFPNASMKTFEDHYDKSSKPTNMMYHFSDRRHHNHFRHRPLSRGFKPHHHHADHRYAEPPNHGLSPPREAMTPNRYSMQRHEVRYNHHGSPSFPSPHAPMDSFPPESGYHSIDMRPRHYKYHHENYNYY